MKQGIVYFIGAGPGDPELLTVKGRRLLQEADVIVYDRLVHPILLMETREDAQLVYCGKKPCQHTLRQEDIQKQLLIYARRGLKVVRLKGGDPSVFGRVGEEAELLAGHEIDYEIVPGITSGIAAPMYAGVPVTHRKFGGSFAMVTGHSKDKHGKPVLEWDSLAKGIDTIAFYMGMKNLSYICEQLVTYGKPSTTPVLVVEWATFGKQRTVEGTLSTISNKVVQQKIANPAITLVGDIVSLRRKLKWFERSTVVSQGIILPEGNNHSYLKAMLAEARLDVYEPSQNVIEGKDTSYLSKLDSFKELVFLSKESISIFIKSLGRKGKDVRQVQQAVYTVDSKVQEELQTYGIQSSLLGDRMKMERPLFLGREEDRFSLSSSMNKEFAVTHQKKISSVFSETLHRLIDDGHADTLLLSDCESAHSFLHFMKEQGMDADQAGEYLSVFCIGKETAELVKREGMPISLVFSSKEEFTEWLTAESSLSQAAKA
ncbi:uroporphyrinogen-III C-methyltransferase [Thalassobacillus sp. C254]|uniref:uroporphyrinogen-III C-methyltransferase n=1 Tax=Thalassobacillus sp. C254 TaxID=1225341 RepID=UPI0006D07B43|nr:uroporphyrinogen-III C-methyltransferase [Thalassobacillus sp. C254]